MVRKSSKTLLLVEDEIFIALSEQILLEKEGYRVLLAGRGEEAVDLVERGKEAIDLILMDINLGQGIDGTQAARDILAKHDIPIIFCHRIQKKKLWQRQKRSHRMDTW